MHTNKIDKAALAKAPEPIVEGFKTLKEKLSRTTELVRDLRDSLGGHVLHSDVQKVLKDMDSGMTGFFQDGEIRGKTRYRFASELVLSIMLGKVEPEAEEEKLETLLGSTAPLISIIEIMDQVIRAYISDRRLLATS